MSFFTSYCTQAILVLLKYNSHCLKNICPLSIHPDQLLDFIKFYWNHSKFSRKNHFKVHLWRYIWRYIVNVIVPIIFPSTKCNNHHWKLKLSFYKCSGIMLEPCSPLEWLVSIIFDSFWAVFPRGLHQRKFRHFGKYVLHPVSAP